MRGLQSGHGKLTFLSVIKGVGVSRFTDLDTVSTRVHVGQKRCRDPRTGEGDFAQVYYMYMY